MSAQDQASETPGATTTQPPAASAPQYTDCSMSGAQLKHLRDYIGERNDLLRLVTNPPVDTGFAPSEPPQPSPRAQAQPGPRSGDGLQARDPNSKRSSYVPNVRQQRLPTLLPLPARRGEDQPRRLHDEARQAGALPQLKRQAEVSIQQPRPAGARGQQRPRTGGAIHLVVSPGPIPAGSSRCAATSVRSLSARHRVCHNSARPLRCASATIISCASAAVQPGAAATTTTAPSGHEHRSPSYGPRTVLRDLGQPWQC